MEYIRPYLPRARTDMIAMAVTFLLIPWGLLYGVLHVVPSLYPSEAEHSRWWRTVHSLAILYGFAAVTYDLVMTMVTETSSIQLTLPEVPQCGWSHCPYCNKFSPPRTQHCLTCEKCILRRDHHCYFVGRCIGYKNHKYFILFLLHVFLCAAYAFVLSVQLVIQLNEGFSWFLLLAAVFPVLIWLLQVVNANPLVLMASCSCAFLFLIGSSVLLVVNLRNLYNGQTFWEASKGVRRSPGLFKNANDLLGNRWWLTILFPFINSELPNDGTHYASTATEVETNNKKKKSRKHI